MPVCPRCQKVVKDEAPFGQPCKEEPQRVGLFVDYENFRKIGWLGSSNMSIKRRGEVLKHHAEQYGKVVCRWMFAHPRNVPNWRRVSSNLKQAGFMIGKPAEVNIGRYAHPESQQADHALIRQLYEEARRSQPSIYIIVSGDSGYYEHIVALLEQGHSVRLWASKIDGHLSEKYDVLEKRYRPGSKGRAGKGDFLIEDLDDIFRLQGVRTFFRRPDRDEKGPPPQAAA